MKSDLAVLARLLGLARPQAGWMLLAGFVACITVLASVALMGIAGGFIAAMAIAGVTTGMMNYFLPAAAIRFCAILRTGGRYLERLLSHEATFRLLAGLRLWLFRRLEPLSPGQLMDKRGADLASALQADVDTLQHAYLRLGAPMAVALACGIAVVAVLVALHPPIALLVAALLLSAGGLVPALVRRAALEPSADAVRRRAALRVGIVDFLQGATDLRAAGAVERRLSAIKAGSAALADAQRRAATLGSMAEAGAGFCARLALWGAAVLAAAAVTAGELAPHFVPALALAAFASFEAVTPLSAAFQRWGEVMEAARRVFAMADRTPDIVAGPDPSPEPRDAGLAFNAVSLRYTPDGPLALDRFDLAIPDGRRVALLGPSGAGKSSLARLLLRFFDYEGEIRLGAHDLRRYRPQDLRQMIGVAPQDAQLFNGSIADNLLMASPDADAAAMRRVLGDALLLDFVDALPHGLDTWIGEGGTRLSAGERRRLVIARTLLGTPRIFVLDEPTENLDPTTARRLMAALAQATRGRTTLLITHDPLAAADFADETIRMEAGRIVQSTRRSACDAS